MNNLMENNSSSIKIPTNEYRLKVGDVIVLQRQFKIETFKDYHLRTSLVWEDLPTHYEDEPINMFQDSAKIPVIYTNYRNETSKRLVTPIRTYFGSTEYHPEQQWLMEVFDHEKNARRTYALNQCNFIDAI